MLQSGKFFIAAQIILFGKLGLLQAILALYFGQPLHRCILLGTLQFARHHLPVGILGIAQQLLQRFLAAAEFFFQRFLYALRLPRFHIHALGVDKAELLQVVGGKRGAEQAAAQ